MKVFDLIVSMLAGIAVLEVIMEYTHNHNPGQYSFGFQSEDGLRPEARGRGDGWGSTPTSRSAYAQFGAAAAPNGRRQGANADIRQWTSLSNTTDALTMPLVRAIIWQSHYLAEQSYPLLGDVLCPIVFLAWARSNPTISPVLTLTGNKTVHTKPTPLTGWQALKQSAAVHH